MGLAAAVLITMILCRPRALISIDPSREQWREDGQSVVVFAREKTDFGRGMLTLVIRGGPEERLSPLFYYKPLADRSRRLGAPNALFCSEQSKAYKRPDRITHVQVELLGRMGVEGFTAYSFRHAMI